MTKRYVLAEMNYRADRKATYVFDMNDIRIADPMKWGIDILQEGSFVKGLPKQKLGGHVVRTFLADDNSSWYVYNDRSAVKIK